MIDERGPRESASPRAASLPVSSRVAIVMMIGLAGLPGGGLADDLLITCTQSGNVLRVNGITGEAVEMVPDGRGGLDTAHFLEIGPDANWYVCSFGSGDVLRFDGATGSFIDTFIPSGRGGLDRAAAARFGPGGYLYVSSYGSAEVLRYEPRTGDFVDRFARLPGADRAAGFLHWPGDGLIYVISGPSNEVFRFDENTGALVDRFIDGTPNDLIHPHYMLWRGTYILIDSFGSGDVQRYDAVTGEFVDVLIESGVGGLDQSHGLVIGDDDLLYVLSAGSDAVLRFDPDTGEFIDEFSRPGQRLMDSPTSLRWVPSFDLRFRPPQPGEAGVVNTFTVTGAEAGFEVQFFYSFTSGVTLARRTCTGAYLRLENPVLAASAIADPTGVAQMRLRVPARATGRRIALQAAQRETCRVSDRIVVTFE